MLLSGRTSTDKLLKECEVAVFVVMQKYPKYPGEREKRILSAVFVKRPELVVNAYVELMEQPTVSFSPGMDRSVVYVL